MPDDVAPVPPFEILNGLLSVKLLNVGDADVLRSCGVLIVNVLDVPDVITPLLLVKDTTPLLVIDEVPAEPVNVMLDGVLVVVIA